MSQSPSPGFDLHEVINMAAELAARKATAPLQEQIQAVAQDVEVVKNRLLGTNGTTGLIRQFEQFKQYVYDEIRQLQETISANTTRHHTMSTWLKASWKTVAVVAVVLWEVYKEAVR